MVKCRWKVDRQMGGWVGRWIVERTDCRLRGTCVLHSMGDEALV